MTKKELKKEFRNERISAKTEYKNRITLASDSYKKRLDEYYSQAGKRRPINPPKRPILEEIGNSISHGLGSLFAVIALILMLVKSESVTEIASAVIYFFGMFVMFTCSCLYHAFSHGSVVKRLFRRFDYSSIYLLIGATFAPVLLCVFQNEFGTIFFAVQWLVIALGISLVGVFGPTRLRFVHIPLYVILGWSALMLFPGMIGVSLSLALWILAGGVIYTVGIIPFLIKSKVAHFIWHIFVFAAAIVQWIGIYTYVYKA